MWIAESITDQAGINRLTEQFLAGGGGIVLLIWYLLVAIALWRVFSKAGYPGILALIPIVNVFFLVKVGGYSAWMTLLFAIPIVNIVFGIILAIRVGERFGKGPWFSIILLWLFSAIGYLILGFGDARYTPRRRN
ncbi:DUF5684 domain-containing protein [Leucobacter massiliensis]|uniref:Signal peptidase I n=1 Tax=Leucobacter massiliensis TaxID=1686285 RepID=A0A2S9QRT2_9MICO|nr:DUF5684 domain-containing protein [Leucobacter massiliensis]PRI12288.1 hypothetical protein B4915_04075 [Leucobacter massiliensis]